MTALIPPPLTPRLLGLPGKFDSFRPHQRELLEAMLGFEGRSILLCPPTGIGKSFLYMALAAAMKKRKGENGGGKFRALFLTATKSLQDQLQTDFLSMGLKLLKGRINYPCRELSEGGGFFSPARPEHLRTCFHGPCRAGYECLHRKRELEERGVWSDEGCGYFLAIEEALGAELVVANYAMDMSMAKYSHGLGKFDLLVCDEFHAALDQVCGFLQAGLDLGMAESLRAGVKVPDALEGWLSWAVHKKVIAAVASKLEAARSAARRTKQTQELDRWEAFEKSRSRLAEICADQSEWPNWVREQDSQRALFRPVWPKKHAEEVLFRATPKLILSSATSTPKTASLLGLGGCLELSAPHPAPLGSRMLTLVRDVPRLNYSTERRARSYWLSRIDQELGKMVGYKAVVHTVSHDRAKYIAANSVWRNWMIHHCGASGGVGCKNSEEAVAAFKSASPPAILVSPSISTGHDFPHDACRLNILAKFPWPDFSDKVLKARCADDPQFALHSAIVETVQATGRANRDKDDWARNLIMDDTARILASAKAKALQPEWFWGSFEIE